VSKKQNLFSPKALAFTAICIAMAYVLREISPFRMPQGGRFAIGSTFFLALVGYLYGVKMGILAGVSFGLLRLIGSNSLFHPMQIILDFPLAFGVFGISGFFKKSEHGLQTGYIFGSFLRFLMHFLSGIIFFAQYAPEGTHPWAHSALYNASYISVELAITLVIISVPQINTAIKMVKQKIA